MREVSGVTAAILAGGLGTRLRSVVADRPKVLAEIRGRPFLAFLLDQLADAGLRSAVLCTGYMGDEVRAAFGDSHRGMRLSYSQEPAPLGTGGAIRLAAEQLSSATALVMNGDSYCQLDVGAFWADHCAAGSRATLALVRVDDASRFGQVELDASRRIVRFEEKGARSGPGWINAGLYLVDRSWLEAIPSGRAVSLEREVFPGWIARGLMGWPCAGPFLDIGTPESYREADRFFAARDSR
jgi:NDP-sugar pyrophosphorylase family protein